VKRGGARDMPEEKEKKMVGERRRAQRIKRVLADTTPHHLEQLTKQARALTGDDEGAEVQGSSMEAIRARLGNLQQRHSSLRDKLTKANPPHKDFNAKMEVCLCIIVCTNQSVVAPNQNCCGNLVDTYVHESSNPSAPAASPETQEVKPF
jgi:hypothetical protein